MFSNSWTKSTALVTTVQMENHFSGAAPVMSDFTFYVNRTFFANATEINHTRVSGPSSIEHKTWGWWLLQIGTPLLVLVGVPGNILSFLVMKSKRLRSKSYAHYLCTLAVFDSLVLIGKFMTRLDKLMLATQHEGLVQKYGSAACKIDNFAKHVCYLMSCWLILCITLERFIAVHFPFRKHTFCRPRNAVTVILAVFVMVSYSQIFRLIVMEKIGFVCTVSDDYLSIFVIMHIYMYQLVLQFTLPAGLIMIFNLTILYKIRKLGRNVNKHGCSHALHAYSKRHRTTCMLMVVSFTYVVTLFPLVFLSIMLHITSIYNKPLGRHMVKNLEDVSKVMEFFSELNFACNFFIYVFSGEQFRYELKNLCMRNYGIFSNVYTERVFQFRKSNSYR